MKNNTLSINVDFIRVISIFAVVLLHISAALVVEIKDYSSYKWIIGNFFDSFVRWCVPVFIMLSGYLLLQKNKLNEKPATFYKKRFFRLGFPILVWSIFFLIWGIIKTTIKGVEEPTLFNNIVLPLLTGTPHYHLWFLFMIICLYLVTPLIRKLVLVLSTKELWTYTIIFLIISSVETFYESTKYKPFFLNFIQYIPYFILGYLISKVTYSKKYFTYSTIIFIFSNITTFVGTYYFVNNFDNNQYILYNYLSITTVIASITIFYILLNVNISKQIKKLSLIAPMTLGIYIIHPLFIESLRFIGLKVENYNPLLSIPIFTIFIFLLSYLIVLLLMKLPYIKRTLN